MPKLLLLAALALPPGAGDAPSLPVELQELTPAQVNQADSFGFALARDGELAVVGAPLDDWAGTSSGSAYVLRATPQGWVTEERLTRPGATAGDNFGRAVAVSDELVAVGALLADDAGDESGAVHLFRRVGPDWVQEQALAGVPFENFGAALALDGERLAVGGGWMANRGSVRIFERQAGVWTQVQLITPTSTDFSQAFGNSVDLDGERLLVGSPQLDQGPLPAVGAAYVYRLQGGSYALEATLMNPNPAPTAWEGWAVALEGPLAVVGAPTGNGGGAAHLYSRESGTWTHELALVAPQAQPSDEYGRAVAIDGETIVIGAAGRDTFGVDAGLAFVFERQGGVFRLSSFVSPADHASPQRFGESVSLQDGSLLVGSRSDGDHVFAGGSMYAFELQPALREYCFGDGSAAPCPCGNSTPPGQQRGCANSSGTGATLSGSRSVSVLVDDLLLSGTRLAAGQPALLFVGTNAVASGAGIVLGDGLLCAGGSVRRLGVQSASASGAVLFGPDLSALGGWSAGDTRYFQLWYRDPAGPCGQGVNLSAALEARFTP